MNASRMLLKMAGWKVNCSVPDIDKCIICVAPHTSNWDFVIGKLAYASVGRTASFLMKETWFFFPLGPIFRAMGGIPVPRPKNGAKAKSSLVDALVERFAQDGKLQIAITPEGTRSRTAKWRTGFLHIATRAGVPCVLAAIDYERKEVLIDNVFYPTGDIDADMQAIKRYFSTFKGKHPDKFTTEDT